MISPADASALGFRMDLQDIDGSPFLRSVRMLLRDFDLAVSLYEITDFPAPDSFLSLNPMGQVPDLLHGGQAHFPTRAVLDVLLAQAANPKGAIASYVCRADHPVTDEQVQDVIPAMGGALASHHCAVWAEWPRSERIASVSTPRPPTWCAGCRHQIG